MLTVEDHLVCFNSLTYLFNLRDVR